MAHDILNQAPTYPTGSLDCFRDVSALAVKGISPAKVKLDICIVGAGLGGLATAVALAQTGHQVTMYEQAPQLGEVGAGIQIPPNSARILQHWGIGKFLNDRAVSPSAINFRRWQDGSTIGCTALLPDLANHFGASYLVCHRAHLHEALHKLAVENHVRVELGRRVLQVDPRKPSIVLDDGATHHADLIVGADGIKSVLRDVVTTGPEVQPFVTPSAFAAYRAVVDASAIRDDPDTAWLLKRPDINVWIGDNRHVMTYLISGQSSFNMVLSHPETSDPVTWKQDAVLDEMRSQFSGWCPVLCKLLGMIPKTLKWPLVSGSKLSRWIHPSGKLLILGDAAHAMLPYMSQGAAMAVEDGAALGEILRMVHSKDDVPRALLVWEKERMQRTYQMQDASLLNSKLWHFPDGPEQEIRDKAMRPEIEGRPYVSSPNQWSDPTTQRWCYGYDAEIAVHKAWLSAQVEDGQVAGSNIT